MPVHPTGRRAQARDSAGVLAETEKGGKRALPARGLTRRARWRPLAAMFEAMTERPLAAAAHMVAAMCVIGVIDNFIALIARDVGLWQFLILRGAVAIPLVVALAALGLGRIAPRRYWAIALRSLSIALAMLFYFGALAVMPIAQALAGLFTSPMFILLISATIMRRKVGPIRILAVLLGFLGVVLVLEPDPARLSAWSLLPVAGGFFYALAALATRTICAGEDTLAMLHGMLVAQVALSLLALAVIGTWGSGEGFVLRGWEWPVTQVWPLILLQAVGSVLGVGLIIRAYQLGDATFVGIYEYSVFIFGPAAAWWLFGSGLSGVQTAGIALVAAAGVVIAMRQRQEAVA